MADPEIRIKVNASGKEAEKTFQDVSKSARESAEAIIAAGKRMDEAAKASRDELLAATAAKVRAWKEEKAAAEAAGKAAEQDKADGILSKAKARENAINTEKKAIEEAGKIVDGYGNTAETASEKTGKLSKAWQDATKNSGRFKHVVESLMNPLVAVGTIIGVLITRTDIVSRLFRLTGDAIEYWTHKTIDAFPTLLKMDGQLKTSGDLHLTSAASVRANAGELAKLKTELDGVNQNLREQNDELTRQKSQDDQLAEARKRLALAEVDASGLSEPERLRSRLQIENQFAQEAEQRETRTAEARIRIAREAGEEQLRIVEQIKARIAETEPLALSDEETATREKRVEQLREDLVPLSGRNILNGIFFAPPGEYTRRQAQARTIRGAIEQEQGILDRSRIARPLLEQYQSELGPAQAQLDALGNDLSRDIRRFPEDIQFRRQMGGFEQLTSTIQATSQVGGMRDQARAAASQEVISGQAGRAAEELQQITSVFVKLVGEIAEMKRQIQNAERNNRDQ